MATRDIADVDVDDVSLSAARESRVGFEGRFCGAQDVAVDVDVDEDGRGREGLRQVGKGRPQKRYRPAGHRL